jgi:hypothetical protein
VKRQTEGIGLVDSIAVEAKPATAALFRNFLRLVLLEFMDFSLQLFVYSELL